MGEDISAAVDTYPSFYLDFLMHSGWELSGSPRDLELGVSISIVLR